MAISTAGNSPNAYLNAYFAFSPRPSPGLSAYTPPVSLAGGAVGNVLGRPLGLPCVAAFVVATPWATVTTPSSKGRALGLFSAVGVRFGRSRAMMLLPAYIQPRGPSAPAKSPAKAKRAPKV